MSTSNDPQINGPNAGNDPTVNANRPDLGNEREVSGEARQNDSATPGPLADGLEHRYAAQHDQLRDDHIADALGWLSVGLGLAGLLAPRLLCRATGMTERPLLIRGVGAREFASGTALLTQKRRLPWLWARVAGDVMDLALLGSAALRKENPHRKRTIAALGVVAAISAADLGASVRQSKRLASHETPVRGGHEALVEQSVIVNKPPAQCYAFWRKLENLPKFIPTLRSITVKDERRSHWVVSSAVGPNLEWDSEITADHEGEKIAWRTAQGAAVKHAGNVRFDPAPGGRGTLVRVSMHLEPALGRAGVSIAKFLGKDPNSQTRENLRRFKSLVETGEVPTTVGQPSGRRSWVGRLVPEGRKSSQPDITQERTS